MIQEFIKEFESFNKLCSFYGFSKKQICLQYALQNKFIDFIAIGINSRQNLKDLIMILQSIRKNQQIKIKKLESDSNDVRLIDPRKWPKAKS